MIRRNCRESEDSVYTIFVDNLPNDVRKGELSVNLARTGRRRRILGIEKLFAKAKESIGSKGFMKRNQEGRIVARGVASRLHKHQQKLPTQLMH
ncbi:hypothetical protein PIB30_073570 [Stylosanthes scabra]|uniref:Uncharacterized protein n=1 Tax=Stylosanthes scabra TaxID=79078 RepID=A0ABU6UN55_9FABA|nr:hypothetical protein [Stylosanthes scabra]